MGDAAYTTPCPTHYSFLSLDHNVMMLTTLALVCILLLNSNVFISLVVSTNVRMLTVLHSFEDIDYKY